MAQLFARATRRFLKKRVAFAVRYAAARRYTPDYQRLAVMVAVSEAIARRFNNPQMRRGYRARERATFSAFERALTDARYRRQENPWRFAVSLPGRVDR